VRLVAVVVVVIAFVLPAAMMLIGSLRPPDQPPLRRPELIPADAGLDSYRRAFELVDLARQLSNSLFVALIATPLAVVSASLAGFSIARSSHTVSRVLIGLAVLGMVVPPTALLVGRFTLYRELGALDTFVPLVAPALFGVNSLAVLLFAWSFSVLPSSLFDAAELEDVSLWRAWSRIALPMARPMTIAVGTLAFAATWSDFLSPLAFITSNEKFTIPLGLRSLQLVGGDNIAVVLAGCVVATAPVVVVFAVAQRWLFDSLRGVQS
jgi:multiple sugar transport system permease protein